MLLSITWDVDPELFNFFGREIRWYGLFWGIGLLLAFTIVERIYKHEKQSEDSFNKLFWYIFAGIVIGARLGHCLFYNPSYYLSHPIEILYIWEGGLASHGGTLGIIIAVWLYSRKTKLSMLWVLDRVVVSAGITAAFIRIGNFFNSEIYGAPTDLPWGINFVRDRAWHMMGELPCHPTQLYEALVYLIAFGVGMYMYWKTNAKDKAGLILGVNLIIIFLSRILIEYFKNIQEPFEIQMRHTIGLDMGQLLSIPLVLWGVWLVWHASKTKPETIKK